MHAARGVSQAESHPLHADSPIVGRASEWLRLLIWLGVNVRCCRKTHERRCSVTDVILSELAQARGSDRHLGRGVINPSGLVPRQSDAILAADVVVYCASYVATRGTAVPVINEIQWTTDGP